jgi:hypothetical protein
MAVPGHGGNYPEKIAGAQNVALFFSHNLNFLGKTNLSGAYDKKPVSVPFPFDNDIRVFGKINKGKL